MRFRTRLLISVLVGIVALGFAGSPLHAKPAGLDRDQELAELRDQVNAKRLAFDLKLSADQQKDWKARLTEMREAQKKIEAEIVGWRGEEKKRLKEMLDEYQKYGASAPANPNVKRDAWLKHKDVLKPLKEDLRKKLEALLATLTPKQKESVTQFLPHWAFQSANDFGCSATADSIWVELRRLPDSAYQFLDRRLANRLKEQPPDAKPTHPALTKFWEKAQAVRGMPEAEFSTKRKELSSFVDPKVLVMFKQSCENRKARVSQTGADVSIDAGNERENDVLSSEAARGGPGKAGMGFRQEKSLLRLVLSDAFFETLGK